MTRAQADKTLFPRPWVSACDTHGPARMCPHMDGGAHVAPMRGSAPRGRDGDAAALPQSGSVQVSRVSADGRGRAGRSVLTGAAGRARRRPRFVVAAGAARPAPRLPRYHASWVAKYLFQKSSLTAEATGIGP
jgi:hypothetical protein